MSLSMPYMIREELLYPAIQIVADPNIRDIKDADFVYDVFNPSLQIVDSAATLIADAVWYQGESFDWAPPEVSEAVKKGMKAGYLLGRAIFSHG